MTQSIYSSGELAIYGGPPVRSAEYEPYNPLTLEDVQRGQEVLLSGHLSGFVGRAGPKFEGGMQVQLLERTVEDLFEIDQCITVNSATSGLHLALLAAGIGPGDDVIVANASMSATGAAVLMVGATPVFVDIEPDFFCIDCDACELAITKSTKAIIAVNLFGQAADLKRLRSICDRERLKLLLDNAQGIGSSIDGRMSDSFADMSVLSFNIHKVINCGEGGAILTDNPELAETLKLLRNHGEAVIDDLGIADYDKRLFGFNFRLTEVQAAVLVGQVRRLKHYNDSRIELAQMLSSELAEVDPTLVPRLRQPSSHVFYLFPMVFQPGSWNVDLDFILKALLAEGVHVSKYVKPLSQLPIFGSIKCDNCSNSEASKSCALSNACRLMNRELLVTNLCRKPHGRREIIELKEAVIKLYNHLSN